MSAATFETMARNDEFLEHNEVHGNFYGTAKSEVLPRLAAGEDVILDIDVQGARDVRAAHPQAISIFIVPLVEGRARAAAAAARARRRGRHPKAPHQRGQGNRASRVFSVCYRERGVRKGRS